MIQYLTEKAKYANVPRHAAALNYQAGEKDKTVAILSEYIPHQGTAWNLFLDSLHIFFDQVLAKEAHVKDIHLPNSIFSGSMQEIPLEVYETIGSFANTVILLGHRTAELHLALAQEKIDLNFKAEPFTSFDQRALFQSIHTLTRKGFDSLSKEIDRFTPEIKAEITSLLNHRTDFLALAKEFLALNIRGQKIRIHGDFHLGQILFTGKDFFFIDFEGEGKKSLSERRIKRSPLRDVAGILRSFHYAMNSIIFESIDRYANHKAALEKWGIYWYRWVGHIFLKAYLEDLGQCSLLPQGEDQIFLLLRLYMIEKAMHEIEYEMQHRPSWLKIPCHGLLELIGK